MTRAKNTPVTRRRRKKILKQVKGYSIKTLKTAKEQEMNALKDAYIGRKQRKRFFRSNI